LVECFSTGPLSLDQVSERFPKDLADYLLEVRLPFSSLSYCLYLTDHD
jgi:hypothetical protein